ncbi:HEPN domain-containing protein [Sphingomonas sp. ERG5]|uniref:ApeA N-terminal domain 1-containing protein n=1 Tax=Sphingomonas sp. ERG5 TaxID=1381597 RepID=UPI00054B43DE|nr:HEPN domain-containing protein [Sphingomonas sp. ERG5]
MAILEERGIFWWNDEVVPKTHFAPDANAGGKLTIEDSGAIRLDLDEMMPGDRHPFEALADSGQSVAKNVQGLLTNGKHVLLLNLLRRGGTVRTHNVSQERYLARQCLVSEGAFKGDGRTPLSFSALTVDLAGFEDWLRLGSIEVNRHRNKLIAKYRAEKDRHYAVPFGRISIEYDLSGPFPGRSRQHELKLVECARTKIILNERASVEGCQDFYQRVEELLILLTSSDHNLDWPTVVPRGHKQHAKLYFMRYRSGAKAPAAHECLISFPGIADSFGDLFATLVEKREQYGPGLYLYLATRRGMTMLVEHRFVNLIWGLEAFDRSGRGKAQATQAFADKIARIISLIPEGKDRKWLSKHLEKAAEPSLGDRLYSIFSALPLPFDLAALKAFCEECRARRNDISHFGGQRQRDERYSDIMLDLNRKSDALAALYHLHLLIVIGVDKELVDFTTNHNWPLSGMARDLRAAGLLIQQQERAPSPNDPR